MQSPLIRAVWYSFINYPDSYGDLIIGDSHEYSSRCTALNSEEVDNLLIELAEHTLACSVQVKERWQGFMGQKERSRFQF